MEIIVKVTDAELKQMDMTTDQLQACIWDDVVNSEYQGKMYNYIAMKVGIINTDDAKRAIKTTKDKHLAITNNSYEG